MAQHDYDIANQSGANFRADLNNALDAIVSNNSGSSAPSTTFAYEWWIDTSNNLLKLRNSANNAWITLPLSITADNATSGGLTVNGNLATTGTVDINGQELILDADADTSITADTDDQIDFRVGAVDVMTLTNSHLVLKGTTPKITIGDGGAEDTALIFDGNAQDFYIGLDDSADDLVIGTGSTVGTNGLVVIENGGNVGINTLTPSFRLDVNGSLSSDGNENVMRIAGADANNAGGITINNVFGSTAASRVSTLFSIDGQDQASPLAFGNGTTEAMRIDSAGRLMIGTTTEGQADADDLTVANASGNVGISLRTTTTGYASIYFSDATSGGAEASGAVQYKHDDNFLRFTTAESERMRILSSGALLVGKTADNLTDSGFTFKKRVGSDHAQLTCVGTGSSSVETYYIYDSSNSEYEFFVSYAGAVHYRSLVSLSDERKKDNIADITFGLDAIKELRPVSFDWKNNKGNDQLGFLAQEVETTSLKKLVSTYKDENIEDCKSLNKEQMIPVLVKAIQEQQDIIDDLKTRVETLEG